MAENRISIPAARGNFLTWCISGFMPLGELCRPLYFGQKLESATNAEVGEFYTVYSVNTAMELFGAGSQLALMAKQHFCTCPEIPLHLAPIPEPTSGTKAVHEITILGPATDNGILSGAILDEIFSVGILVGTDAASIATALGNALMRWRELPFDVTVNGDKVVLTAKNYGLIGNWLNIIWNPSFGDSFPPGVGVEVETVTPGNGVIVIDDALPVLECQFDCVGLGTEDEMAVNTVLSAIRENWKCNVQGDFRGNHLFHSKTATNGIIAAYGLDRNNPEESVIPVPPDFKYPGYLFVAAMTSRVCCTACSDPSRPVQYDNGILGCLFSDSRCSTIFPNDVKRMFYDAGIVNWDVANTRGVRNTALWIEEPFTTWKYDPHTGAPDGAWQRVESRYTVRKFVRDLGFWYKRHYSSVSLVNDGVKIPPGKRAVNPGIMQAAILAWFGDTQLGWTADLGPIPLEQMIRVMRTNTPNNCDPGRLSVMIDLDLVNQLARIATTIDVSPEFSCLPPTVTSSLVST